MNIDLIKNHYKDLVPQNREAFLHDLKYIKQNVDFKLINKEPVLIFAKGKRRAFYYALCFYLSLSRKQILDFTTITGRKYIDQTFEEPADRDEDYRDIRNNMVSFVSLSASDLVSDYMEMILINLVESRFYAKDITIILVDTSGGPVNIPKMRKYFEDNYFPIIDLSTNQTSNQVGSKVKVSTVSPKTAPRKKGDPSSDALGGSK